MISKFVTIYPGHIELPDMGQDATSAMPVPNVVTTTNRP